LRHVYNPYDVSRKAGLQGDVRLRGIRPAARTHSTEVTNEIETLSKAPWPVWRVFLSIWLPLMAALILLFWLFHELETRSRMEVLRAEAQNTANTFADIDSG
jgi:hypothetical protein